MSYEEEDTCMSLVQKGSGGALGRAHVLCLVHSVWVLDLVSDILGFFVFIDCGYLVRLLAVVLLGRVGGVMGGGGW
jgi:hypothetical protein